MPSKTSALGVGGSRALLRDGNDSLVVALSLRTS